jgi:hypothetical protein
MNPAHSFDAAAIACMTYQFYGPHLQVQAVYLLLHEPTAWLPQ